MRQGEVGRGAVGVDGAGRGRQGWAGRCVGVKKDVQNLPGFQLSDPTERSGVPLPLSQAGYYIRWTLSLSLKQKAPVAPNMP